MTRTALLGDIGGTRTRFALARDGVIAEETAVICANDDFRDFDALLTHCLSLTGPVDAISLAVAGPLANAAIKMTNRDWVIREETLRQHAGQVVLMNDMVAHALSVPMLGADQFYDLRAGEPAGTGQWMVVNLGTGFNAATGMTLNGLLAVPATEMGMSSLGQDITAVLTDAGVALPSCKEDLFSGRGYAWLKQAVGPGAETLFARCVALLLRDLMAGHLPLDGMYLCGSVAAAVATGPGADVLMADLDAPYAPYAFLANVPIRVITAHDTALPGCLAALGTTARQS